MCIIMSIEEGIKIQTEQLEKWGLVLQEKVYKDLVEWAISKNHEAVNGYNICRGNDLTNFIENYKPKPKKKIVTVQVTRYYSKTSTVEIEVDTTLVGDELFDYLTNDDKLNYKYEYSLDDSEHIIDDTTYEWQDPTDSNGGTL